MFDGKVDTSLLKNNILFTKVEFQMKMNFYTNEACFESNPIEKISMQIQLVSH